MEKTPSDKQKSASVVVHDAIIKEHSFPENAFLLPQKPPVTPNFNADEFSDFGTMPVFCTIQWANFLLRACPAEILRGLSFSRDKMRVSFWSELFSDIPDFLLNEIGVMTTWGALKRKPQDFLNLHANGAFIRPDSGMKPFTGFSVKTEAELIIEAASRNVDDSEICHVFPHKEISGPEIRVWVSQGEIVSTAPYGWNEADESADPSWREGIIDYVNLCRDHLDVIDECVVLDFCQGPEGVRLVEVNAYSTSGMYKQADVKAVIEGLRRTML